MQVVNFTVLTVKYMQIMICSCVKISDIDYYIFLIYLLSQPIIGPNAQICTRTMAIPHWLDHTYAHGKYPFSMVLTVRAHGQYNHRINTLIIFCPQATILRN